MGVHPNIQICHDHLHTIGKAVAGDSHSCCRICKYFDSLGDFSFSSTTLKGFVFRAPTNFISENHINTTPKITKKLVPLNSIN